MLNVFSSTYTECMDTSGVCWGCRPPLGSQAFWMLHICMHAFRSDYHLGIISECTFDSQWMCCVWQMDEYPMNFFCQYQMDVLSRCEDPENWRRLAVRCDPETSPNAWSQQYVISTVSMQTVPNTSQIHDYLMNNSAGRVPDEYVLCWSRTCRRETIAGQLIYRHLLWEFRDALHLKQNVSRLE